MQSSKVRQGAEHSQHDLGSYFKPLAGGPPEINLVTSCSSVNWSLIVQLHATEMASSTRFACLYNYMDGRFTLVHYNSRQN